MIATLSAKGQVTVPKDIRDKCSLDIGDKLDFLFRDDGVLEVIPIKQPASRLKGMLPHPPRVVSPDEMNKAIAEGASGNGGY
jgi:AbrB family looped-hinge helix DNA binding protein